MKFYAFLKDSYREAINGWVLQAMLLLSFLLVLFIASISFRPQPLNEQLGTSIGFINKILPTSPEYPNMGSPKFSVENFSETNPIEPWKSDYTFDFVVTSPSAADLQKAKDRGRALPVTRPAAERFLKQGFDFLKDLKVENVKSNNPDASSKLDPDAAKDAAPTPAEARFHVTSKGTTISDKLEWRHEPALLFFIDVPLLSTSLREGVYFMQKWLVNGAGAWLTLIVSIVVTAGFIPNMLGKGTLDLLISKPISKPLVLLYKYIGGLTFVLLVTSFTAFGVWLVLGVRTGLWSPNFLLIVPILTFYFAILYAISTLTAVLTRNMLVAILATVFAWAIFWGIGKVNDGICNRQDKEAEMSEKLQVFEIPKPGENGEPPDADDILRRLDPNSPLWTVIPKSTFPVFQALHAISPRTYDLDTRLGRIIAGGVLTEREMKQNGYGKPPRETWPAMLLVSLAFIMVCLALSAYRMQTRDG